MTLAIPPRPSSLDRNEPGGAFLPPGEGRPWWAPLRPWPPDMRFEDVSQAELEHERRFDVGALPPPEISIASSAGLCVDVAPMLERGADVALRKWIRRRFHPIDRGSLKVPA
jgi:hypothetical protein